MTRRKDITQSQPITPDKWERQRQAERIAMLLNMRKAA